MSQNMQISETEAKVAALWKAAFGLNEIEPHQNYFEIGGDSLLMIDMLIQLGDDLGIEIDPGCLFEDASLRGFAANIDRQKSAN